MSSASGGKGMYSLAPAWMAATRGLGIRSDTASDDRHMDALGAQVLDKFGDVLGHVDHEEVGAAAGTPAMSIAPSIVSAWLTRAAAVR